MGSINTELGDRCPYCVGGLEFKKMVAHVDGRLICAKCGHIQNPANPSFRCDCYGCRTLRGETALKRNRWGGRAEASRTTAL